MASKIVTVQSFYKCAAYDYSEQSPNINTLFFVIRFWKGHQSTRSRESPADFHFLAWR